MKDFTDRARRVMALANEEARRLWHEQIEDFHILLGLVEEGSGVGATALKELGVDLLKVRLEVEKRVKSGSKESTQGKLPYGPIVDAVIGLADTEAARMGHDKVGTEHLLFGLMGYLNSVSAKVLQYLGVSERRLLEEITKLLNKCPNEQISSAVESVLLGISPQKFVQDEIVARLKSEISVSDEGIRVSVPFVGVEYFVIRIHDRQVSITPDLAAALLGVASFLNRPLSLEEFIAGTNSYLIAMKSGFPVE